MPVLAFFCIHKVVGICYGSPIYTSHPFEYRRVVLRTVCHPLIRAPHFSQGREKHTRSGKQASWWKEQRSFVILYWLCLGCFPYGAADPGCVVTIDVLRGTVGGTSLTGIVGCSGQGDKVSHCGLKALGWGRQASWGSPCACARGGKSRHRGVHQGR